MHVMGKYKNTGEKKPTQQTRDVCIPFIERRPNVFDLIGRED